VKIHHELLIYFDAKHPERSRGHVLRLHYISLRMRARCVVEGALTAQNELLKGRDRSIELGIAPIVHIILRQFDGDIGIQSIAC
jgi:hypothetical protein